MSKVFMLQNSYYTNNYFKPFYILIFFFFSYNSYAQVSERLDSLISRSKTQNGRVLVKTLNEISWEYRNSQIDSALLYGRRSLKVARGINGKQEIASAYHNIASAFTEISELDSALIYHNRSLKIKLEIKDIEGAADTYTSLGILEDIKGHYNLAIEEYFKALRIYEKHSASFEKIPMVLVNIGIVYKKQKEYNKVLDYYKRALVIYKENNFLTGEAIVTGNIGSVLLNLEDYNKSIEYSNKAKELFSSLGYLRSITYANANIAIAQDSLGQYKKAREGFLSVISQYKKDHNLYELSYTKISLSNNYIRKGEFALARKHLKEALKISEENNFKEFKVKALNYLAKVDALTNDLEGAYKYQKEYLRLKDSLFKAEKVKIVFELETKYETEKKEKEILSQRANIAEKELAINQKNTQILGLVLLAIVISLLAYLIFNQQKLKNTQLKKEGELKEALVKIETQNKLQEQRLSISRDLHDNIGAQLTFVISSIENLQYGFKIKNEKLTHKLTGISDFTKDTIYELRDTIWAMNKNSISIDDLQARISNFIDKANTVMKETTFSFKVEPGVSNDTVFSSVEGMNIYRVIQEACNNAIKYAGASKINVLFKKTEDEIIVSIIDDGIGFEEDKVALGSGLSNMRKRITDIGGEIEIDSEINVGTKVSITI